MGSKKKERGAQRKAAKEAMVLEDVEARIKKREEELAFRFPKNGKDDIEEEEEDEGDRALRRRRRRRIPANMCCREDAAGLAFLLEHLHQLKYVSPELLVQCIPRTLESLGVGHPNNVSVSEQVLIRMLWHSYTCKYGCAKSCHHNPLSLWEGAATDSLLYVGLRLTSTALEEFPGCPVRKIAVHFWTTLVNHMRDACKNGGSSTPLYAVRAKLNQACEKMAFIMDELVLDGESGRFLRECPIYNIENDVLANLVDEYTTEIDSGESNLGWDEWYKRLWHIRLRQALAPVFNRSYYLDKECWNPGCTKCFTKASCLNVCGGCKVARYCSKNCQIADWKLCGHKDNCKQMRDGNAILQESIETIDRIHGNGKDNGAALYPGAMFVRTSDYRLLQFIHRNKKDAYQDESRFFDGLKGPRMDIFYANLARVQNGEFWVFPEDASEAASLDEEVYDTTPCDERKGEKEDQDKKSNEAVFEEQYEYYEEDHGLVKELEETVFEEQEENFEKEEQDQKSNMTVFEGQYEYYEEEEGEQADTPAFEETISEAFTEEEDAELHGKEAHEEFYGEEDEIQDHEKQLAFCELAYILSHDFLSFVEQRNSISDPVEIWKIVAREYPVTGPLIYAIGRQVGRVSSKDFLLWYQSCAHDEVTGIPVDGPEWNARRRIFIQNAMTHFYVS